MITLILTSKLNSTNNAVLFSQSLNESLKKIQLVSEKFFKFCEVCRIFIKVFDPMILDFSAFQIESKIRFEIHSGSMIEDEEKLYRELDVIIFKLKNHKVDFNLLRHS
jgi:hypothetical protein